MKSFYTLFLVFIGTVLMAQEKPIPTPKQRQPVPEIKEGPDLKSNTTQQEEILSFCEEMPSYKGGDSLFLEYLRDNINYPQPALENETVGKVYVSFVVEKDGSISNIKVLRGITEVLDREAKRVIRNMPNWNPGKQDNKLVRCRMVVPIDFKMK